MTFEVATVTYSQIEVSSVSFTQSKIVKVDYIDMHAVLKDNGMWLFLEGFENGYDLTEIGVDSLHIFLHTELADKIN